MKWFAATHWFVLALGIVGTVPATAGTLRGTLTRASNGLPVAGAVVTASRPGIPFGVSAHTTTLSNAAGQYEFTGLPAANYTVNANAVGTDLVRQLYPSAYCAPETCDQAISLPGVTNLSLGESQVIEGIDFALAQGGAIEGQVRRADTQALLSGTTITILPLGWQVQTDTNGTFHTTRVPPGSFRLRATGSGDLVSTLHPNVPCEFSACADDFSAATLVVLGAGASLTRHIAMPVGASISGSLQPASAVANHTLRFDMLYENSRTLSRMVVVAADGSYRIDGLASGDYRLSAHSNVIRSQVYPNLFCGNDCAQQLVSGTPVATVVGQTTTPIDFVLTPAARISGVVTDAATGVPLSDVKVSAYEWLPNVPPSGNPGAVIVSSAVTAADGSYLIEGISPRTIRIATFNERGYRDERFDNQLCAVTPQCMQEDIGTLYPMNWAGFMTANFQLDNGASIFGRIRGPGIVVPLAMTTVEVYNLTGQRITALLPKSDGSYQTTGMNPGAYRVRAIVTFFGSIMFGQVYGGMSCSYVPTADCDVSTGTVLDATIGVPVEANIGIEPIFVGTFDP